MLKGISSKPKQAASAKATKGKGQPELDDFLDKKDYMGALTLLEFKLRCQDGDMKDLLMWIGYCAFHLGNFHRAEEAYKELFDNYKVGDEVYLYQACCYFYQQMYEEAEKAADMGPPSELKTRLLFNIGKLRGVIERGYYSIYTVDFLFHVTWCIRQLSSSSIISYDIISIAHSHHTDIYSQTKHIYTFAAHRTGDEEKLMKYHHNLKDRKADQLSLAAVHYLRSHHQEATDIYKRLLLENRDDLAINV